MPGLPRYLFGTMTAPAETMTRLLNDPRRGRRATAAVLLIGCLYALTSVLLAAVGAVPLAPLILDLQPGNYYLWQTVFVIPGVVAVWLVAAALIRLAGRGRKTGGGFGRAADAASMALAVPLLIAWIPSALESGLLALGMRQEEFVELVSPPGVWQTAYIGLYLAALLAALGLMTQAAAVSQRSGRPQTLVAGLLSSAAVAFVFAGLIR
jgi:hypothetical protein